MSKGANTLQRTILVGRVSVGRKVETEASHAP